MQEQKKDDRRVIHRVGGLEVKKPHAFPECHVIHRVGGLEVEIGELKELDFVIHRVGGLEDVRPCL